ncbi:MAG: hydantoinase B/oxoprolinase family protein [Chloroflexi bacterium]|nr:hydantoinase B/oxoprolinase family protein [Chloroflexota bacterium]
MDRIDPITLEIVQNRLVQVGREAGIAMVRAAASLVVVGAKDLGFNIADHLGRTVVYSIWMPRHGTTLAYMLRSCLDRFGEKGINPGDMFLVNNPHDGALHVLDLAVISPVHYEGEIVAWTGCATHHLDVRGMRPGFTPDATDWYQEGIIFRPIKLVEGGKLRDDIFDFFLDNVRVPRYQGLDLKAQIAANNVARDKLAGIAGRYGVETLKRCYDEIIDFSEVKARERIRQLPPGEYEATELLDYDRVYRLKCRLTVEDGTIAFDFAGTDRQAGSFVNSAMPCTVANVHNIVTCLLMPDIPANEGCFRPVSVTAPPGTVLSCQPPAPCSGASTIGGWKAQILAIKALSLAMEKSRLSWRANASWGSGWVGLTPYGPDQYGRQFTMTFMSSVMQGGGARANKDGFDVANIAGSTNTSVPNVEDTECRYPFLFLKRGISPDSGGPGKFRGGVSAEIAVKIHHVPSTEMFLGYAGRDAGADGFAGGWPGAGTMVSLKRQTDVNERLKTGIPEFADLKGERQDLPQKNRPFVLGPDDVLYMRCQGGGGFGHPLERDRQAVLHDVTEGYVSAESARRDYGLPSPPLEN